MDRLRNLIIEKSNNLSNTEIPHELERDFFEELLKEYNAYSFDSYENVSNVAYLMAVLAANEINMSFADLVENIRIVQDFVNDVDFEISLYDAYLNKLLELNDLSLLDKIINNEKLNKLDIKSKRIYNEYKKICKKLFIVEHDDREQYDYKLNLTFDKLFKALPQPEKFKSFISLHVVIDELKEFYDAEFNSATQDDMFDDFVRSLFKGRQFNRIIEKEKNKLVNMRIKEFIEINQMDLFEEYEIIKKHNERIVKEAKEVVKNTNKKIKSLEELGYKLKYINPNRLLKIDSIDSLILDDEIKYNYFLLAVNHNNKIYEKEEEKNIEFNNNSFNKLEILFSKYNLNFNDFTEEEKQSIVNETGYLHVESMLNSIKYSELSFICEYVSEFVNVIIFSKPEIIKFLDILLKNKIIDRKFIFKNINILCDTKDFKNLYDNINYLSSIGINVNNVVKDDPDILMLDNGKLVTTTNLLTEYKLKLNKEDVYNFDILKNIEMLDLLDNYIELGLEKVILENPRYLNNKGFDTIKRIMICNLAGINPINKSNKIIGSVSTGNNFYIDSNDYDNFIIDYKEDYQSPTCLDVLKNNNRNTISASTKSRVFVQKLDELYMKDDLTYVINGVIISRNRVLRNLEILLKHLYNNLSTCDLVYQAILYKMVNNIEPDVLEGIYNSIYLIDLQIEKGKTYTLK